MLYYICVICDIKIMFLLSLYRCNYYNYYILRLSIPLQICGCSVKLICVHIYHDIYETLNMRCN